MENIQRFETESFLSVYLEDTPMDCLVGALCLGALSPRCVGSVHDPHPPGPAPTLQLRRQHPFYSAIEGSSVASGASN